MSIELISPPRIPGKRSQRDHLIDTIISAAGGWVQFSLDELGGTKAITKQSNLSQAANLRHIKVQTSMQGGYIYARLMGS